MSRVFLAAVAAVSISSVASAYDFLDYYVGIDGRPDLTGALVNHQNPNFGRLSLLFSHVYPNAWSNLDMSSNHYHRVGSINYVIPPGFTAANPVPADQVPATTFGNARLPESTYPDIKMKPGTGAWAGKFVTSDRPQTVGDRSTEYDNLRIASVHTMRDAAGADPGSQAAALANNNPAQALYYSSRFTHTQNGHNLVNQPRYTGMMDDVLVGLRLVSISPGLNIAEPDGDALFTGGAGTVETLGPGNTFDFSFALWVDGSAALDSRYSAFFELINLNTASTIPGSGQWRFDVQAVPEPATLGLLAGAAMLALRRR
jgi:hypothetical protein